MAWQPRQVPTGTFNPFKHQPSLLSDSLVLFVQRDNNNNSANHRISPTAGTLRNGGEWSTRYASTLSLALSVKLTLCALDVPILHQMSGCTITRPDDSTVIKKGTRVIMDEEPALRLAKEHGLPVPRVHEAQQSAGREVSLRMDYVPGKRLDSVWPTMTDEEKDSICQQLRQILTTMRSIVPPEKAHIGSCSGGIARDCRSYSVYEGGPFPDETSFNSFILDLVATVPGPIRTALRQQLGSNHRIVFSHGDIAQHNILVQDNQITGLLDWEYAGWYPEYWDYVKFFERPCKHRDWKDRADQIFPQAYPSELASCQGIARWQRP